MKKRTKIIVLAKIPTGIAAKARAEVSVGASAESAARRIAVKRIIRRRKRLLRLRRGLLAVSIVILLGAMSYVVRGFGAAKSDHHYAVKTKAVDAQLLANKQIYNCFVTVGSTGLKLSLPAKLGNVIGVGFHQAERKNAYPMVPTVACFGINDTTTTVRNAILSSKVPVLFTMSSRGRGSPFTSAADIALLPDSDVYSPVDGVITLVRTYNLYGRLMDYQVDIQPDGHPDLRVAIIHIKNIQVTNGQRVTRQKTIIGRMRPLPEISSQILEYLPHQADHVHIQVNPATAEDNVRD